MFKTVSNIWKVEDLRKTDFVTLFILIVYRIGSFIPVPNINKDVFTASQISQVLMCSVY